MFRVFLEYSCFDLSNLGLIFIELPCRFIRTIPYDIQNLKQMWAMFGANKVLVLSISAIYLLLLTRNGLNFSLNSHVEPTKQYHTIFNDQDPVGTIFRLD